ncbi:MAG: hypothetical protein WD341_08765 [Tistlia sp.]|uniref:hypothetical protein n=1 Tax=Tistlia sp. TaxID=3057121 RepID=UPI0034A12779
MLPALIAAGAGWLFEKLAKPAIREVAGAAYESVTGEKVPAETSVKGLAERIQALPPEDQAVVVKAMLDQEVELARIDARQQEALTKGSAEWVRATARPEIALRAMKSIQRVLQAFGLLVAITVLQWAVETGAVLFGAPPPDVGSVWALLAEVKDVWELVAITFGSGFAACVAIVRRYMAARERDKAQEYELAAGSRLHSSGAVETAAGGLVGGLIKAVRGK